MATFTDTKREEKALISKAQAWVAEQRQKATLIVPVSEESGFREYAYLYNKDINTFLLEWQESFTTIGCTGELAVESKSIVETSNNPYIFDLLYDEAEVVILTETGPEGGDDGLWVKERGREATRYKLRLSVKDKADLTSLVYNSLVGAFTAERSCLADKVVREKLFSFTKKKCRGLAIFQRAFFFSEFDIEVERENKKTLWRVAKIITTQKKETWPGWIKKIFSEYHPEKSCLIPAGITKRYWQQWESAVQPFV